MFRRLSLAIVAILAFFGTAEGLIKALLPIDAMVATSSYVVLAQVDKFYPDKPAMMLTVKEDLKGKAPFRRIPVNLAADAKDAEKKYQPDVLKRLGEEQKIVLFINHRGKKLTTFAFLNGSWFQLLGQQTGPEKAVWSFVTGEPYLRRTFKGTTAELEGILKDAIDGKKKPPQPDEKEKPGFGPELEKKSSSLVPTRGEWRGGIGTGSRLFAVIPTLGVGAPLAILAILFPTVFGGVLVLFRQWAAFITLLSINSTLLILHALLGGVFRGTWIADPAPLWIVMGGVTLACLLWAWRRQVANVSLGMAAVETPERTENRILAVLSLILLAVMAFFYWANEGKFDTLEVKLCLALSIGVWLATMNKALRTARRSRSLAVPLSTEGVMLAGAALVALGLIVTQKSDVSATVLDGEAQESDLVIQFNGKPRWTFVSPETNVFVSNPLIVGDRVFVAGANPAFKFGVLYCVDRRTGKELWKFDDDGGMIQVYSSPTHADGRLYIGEGFHDDPDCRIYCVDAATGKLIWKHQTKGQTESSPTYALGRVYFGAGNEGFVCVDANETETVGDRDTAFRRPKVIWSFPNKGYTGRLLRFCGSPAVVQGRVYTGTGVDRNQETDKGETAIFCLDSRTGALAWKTPVPLPCWGAPVVEGNRVYVTLGNGDIVKNASGYDASAKDGGAVWCLNAESGAVIWKRALENSVLNEVALDDLHVYAGSRSGHCVCLKKSSGDEIWKRDMGSPMVGTPALARLGGRTESLLAVSTFGHWAALDPATGKSQWAYQIQGECHFTASPRVHLTRSGRQWFVAGAAGGDLVRGKATLYCIEDRVAER